MTSEKKREDWMNAKWRPMMGWLYMVVCAADFVAFPILYAVYNAVFYNGQLPPGVPSQWQPLTLQGAGLFHIAMGAVLGVTAWGRTQEKLNGANVGGIVQSPYQFTPSQVNSQEQTTPKVISGYGGRPAPIQEPFPVR